MKVLKNKKIAIVSIYDLNNFGNRLQNIAVYRLLKKLNYDPEVVVVDVHRKKDVITRPVKGILKFLKIYNNVRYQSFLEFNKNIEYSKYKLLLKWNREIIDNDINKDYDFFIVGSDQVWNPEFAGFGFYFLDFVKDSKKKIAFSASMGVTDVSKEYANKMKLHLKSFNAISVREQQANDLITSLTQRDDIVTLVDPTMMIEAEEWIEIAKKPEMYQGEDFILNYFLGEQSPKRRQLINDFARSKGYKVINILDEDDPFYTCGPAEFLWLENNAKLICTDSFHSSVFGILFKTPFLVFDREDTVKNMSSRLDNLLRIFELTDRKFIGEALTEKSLDIDYTRAYERLLHEKKKSIDFLINTIEGSGKNHGI